jgi:hypothetical protein
MLKIRPEQIAVFQPVAEAAFISRVVEYLRQELAETIVQLPSGTTTLKELPLETLTAMVEHGITRARSYGLSWESSLATFVAFMFIVAPNFDSHPLIQRVLKDPEVAPEARLEQLWQKTTEENWQAAKHHYDPQAWNLNS